MDTLPCPKPRVTVMLSGMWLLASSFLVFVGLLASDGILMVVGSLVLVVCLAARVWDRYAFRAVSHSRSIGRSRAFIGDCIEYTVSLNNSKALPLIWVDIQDQFPKGLELPGGVLRGSGLENNRHHAITTSLLPYQRASWKYALRCERRGYHRIGPVRLRSGDIFGFTSGEVRLTGVDHVLVYPRVIDLEQVLFPAQHPFGEARGRRPLYQDTNRVIGHRDYRPDDPLKHIDWKATARTRGLQTRMFEPVVSLNLLIAMNASTSDNTWQGSNQRLFERAVTAAASVAALAERRGYSYGLISNAVASYSGKWLNVPVGGSSRQLPLVLEALAMAAPYVVAPLTEVVQAERDTLPAGMTVLLVTSAVTDSLPGQIAAIEARGYQVWVLYSGDEDPGERIGGAPVFSIGRQLDAVPEDGAEERMYEPDLAD